MIHTKPVDQIVLGHLVDQAAFTPIRPPSAPSGLIYLGVKDSIPVAYYYSFWINKERLQPSKKGASRINAIEHINSDHPKLEAFNGNIGHNLPAPITSKDKIDNRIKVASN